MTTTKTPAAPLSTLTGQDAIAYAEAHGLTLRKYADPIEGARSGLTPDEAEDVAREDPSLIYIDLIAGNGCACIGAWQAQGGATASPCEAEGDLVTLEVVPVHLRASHAAAGNSGVWPHNGAEHYRVTQECADELVSADRDWSEIIDD